MRVLLGKTDKVLRVYPHNRQEALMLENLMETLKTTAFGYEGIKSDPRSPDGFRNLEVVNGELRAIGETNSADEETELVAIVIDQ